MDSKNISGFLSSVNEIDIRQLLSELWFKRGFVTLITVIFLLGGILIATVREPLYQSDALIQVSTQNNPLSDLGSIANLVTSAAINSQHSSQASIQATLLQSRFILAPVIQQLGLDISASQAHFPLIGRLWTPTHSIQITELQTPPAWTNRNLKIIKTSDTQYQVYDPDGRLLLTGTVGTLEKNPANTLFSINVRTLSGAVGTRFYTKKLSEQLAIQKLRKQFVVTNNDATQAAYGRGETGIMSLTLTDHSPAAVITKLNTILNVAHDKGIAQQAEEAGKTLAFIDKQIPLINDELQTAETKLSQYQSKSGTLDMPIQSQMLLQQIVSVDNEIQKLKLRRTELLQNFTPKHPFIITLDQKIKQVQEQAAELETKLKNLPNTDKNALGLLRDVKTKNELYVLLLSKQQQLQIMKAGVASNIKILARPYTPPIKLPTHTFLTIISSFLIGFLLSSIIILLRLLFRQGVQDGEAIEAAFDLKTHAIIPHSKKQDVLQHALKKNTDLNKKFVLARDNPKDISIEALRSFRTNLQLHLLETPNNLICISGLAPNVGKSFVSTNLAHVFVDAGLRTLLIDGDLRKGKIHQIMACSNARGLTNFLNNEASLSDIVHQMEPNKLDFIPRGPHVSNPSELLLSPRLKELCESVAKQYDVVIVDTPPVLALSDALSFAALSATNYLLLSAGEHPLREIKAGIDQFTNRHVTLDGVILNFRHQQHLGTHSYYYGYQSRYYDSYASE